MLNFVGIGFSAASLLFSIIGLAVPYWLYASVGDITQYSGLWSACRSEEGQTKCVKIQDSLVDDAFKAARAMEILGMLLIIAGLVIALLKQFAMKDKALLPKIAAGCAIFAGILMIIGTIIFGVDISKLHAGFVLCIVAGVFGIVAGVVMLFAFKGD